MSLPNYPNSPTIGQEFTLPSGVVMVCQAVAPAPLWEPKPEFKNYIFPVQSVTELRLTAGEYNGQTVQLVSYYAGWAALAAPPKGGGVLVWNSTSTAADDGGVTLSVTGVTTGRWIRSLEGYVTPEMFGARGDGVSDDSSPINASFAAFKSGRVESESVDYLINSDVTILLKGQSPDKGRLKIDFTGVRLTGSGNVVVNSCKRLHLEGLEKPDGDLILRGCWFSDFHNCKFSRIIHDDIAGQQFRSSYWNNWWGGTYQQLVISESAAQPFNANRFHGVAWRGDASQAFQQTRSHQIRLLGNVNVQLCTFSGGDVSYYTDALEIGASNTTADIEIVYDSVYWDSNGDGPDLTDARPNWRVVTRDGHIAGSGVPPITARLSTAFRSPSEYWGNTINSGWQPWAAYNYMPNGDLMQNTANFFTSDGGPLGSAGGATISMMTDAGANVLNINQGTSGTVVFRSAAIPFDAPCSAVMMIKHVSGSKSIRFAYGGQNVTRQLTGNWELVAFGSNQLRSAGAVTDLVFFQELGLAFEVQVKYVGVTMGTHPPMMLPQAPNCIRLRQTYSTEFRVGVNTLALRPGWFSGAGSPEGVITAARGSMYSREDGGTGATLYIKEFGTGNTGWVAK